MQAYALSRKYWMIFDCKQICTYKFSFEGIFNFILQFRKSCLITNFQVLVFLHEIEYKYINLTNEQSDDQQTNQSMYQFRSPLLLLEQ